MPAGNPIVGDWNNDGTDTVGLYNPATARYYLRNTNSAGVADTSFTYGAANSGWAPLAGDWNGPSSLLGLSSEVASAGVSSLSKVGNGALELTGTQNWASTTSLQTGWLESTDSSSSESSGKSTSPTIVLGGNSGIFGVVGETGSTSSLLGTDDGEIATGLDTSLDSLLQPISAKAVDAVFAS